MKRHPKPAPDPDAIRDAAWDSEWAGASGPGFEPIYTAEMEFRRRRDARKRVDAKVAQAKEKAYASGRRKTFVEECRAIGDAIAREAALMKSLAAHHVAAGLDDPGGEMIVRIDGLIEPETAERVIGELHARPLAREVTIVLNTRGGDTRSAERIAAAMRAHGGKLRTWAETQCHSAGVLIFAAGRDRVAEIGCAFNHHATVGGTEEYRRATDFMWDGLIAKLVGGDEAFWKKAAKEGRTFSAEEAQAAGLVTEIVDPEALRAEAEEQQAIVDGCPDEFEVPRPDGSVIAFPVNKRALVALAAGMRSGAAIGVPLGLPRSYLAMAAGIAGIEGVA